MLPLLSLSVGDLVFTFSAPYAYTGSLLYVCRKMYVFWRYLNANALSPLSLPQSFCPDLKLICFIVMPVSAAGLSI